MVARKLAQLPLQAAQPENAAEVARLSAQLAAAAGVGRAPGPSPVRQVSGLF